jgi:hypothetical protein
MILMGNVVKRLVRWLTVYKKFLRGSRGQFL